MTPPSWEGWAEHYRSKCFTVLTPAYPGFQFEVEALRENTEADGLPRGRRARPLDLGSSRLGAGCRRRPGWGEQTRAANSSVADSRLTESVHRRREVSRWLRLARVGGPTVLLQLAGWRILGPDLRPARQDLGNPCARMSSTRIRRGRLLSARLRRHHVPARQPGDSPSRGAARGTRLGPCCQPPTGPRRGQSRPESAPSRSIRGGP